MLRKFTQTPFFLRKIHPYLVYVPGYTSYLLRRKSYLSRTGWFVTLRKSASIDAEGQPLPWFTYSMIELLKDRLPRNLSIFEYGCGLGTLWWSEYASLLHAVEHEKEWADQITAQAPDQVSILLREPGKSYVQSVGEKGLKYDVIIIDGRERMACAKEAVKHLSEEGVIIFDDTSRPRYRRGIDLLRESGFKHLPFRGFSPIEFLPCETSLFYRGENILGI